MHPGTEKTLAQQPRLRVYSLLKFFINNIDSNDVNWAQWSFFSYLFYRNVCTLITDNFIMPFTVLLWLNVFYFMHQWLMKLLKQGTKMMSFSLKMALEILLCSIKINSLQQFQTYHEISHGLYRGNRIKWWYHSGCRGTDLT